MVTSLLPTSVGVDVVGIFSITDRVKNLQEMKSGVTLQTLSGRVLQNLTVAQLVKQHPAFY
jgi:hypothetical protein